MNILIVKSNIVVGTSDGEVCGKALSIEGCSSINLDGSVGDVVVGNVLYPRPGKVFTFDFNTNNWIFDVGMGKTEKLYALSNQVSHNILKYFPDTTKCKAVQDKEISYRSAIDSATNQSELDAVVFDWII